MQSSKSCIGLTIVFIFAVVFHAFSLASEGERLGDLYSTGKVTLKEGIRLDEETMPEDMFFEMTMDAVPGGKGNVFVADYRAHKIYKFSPSGKFLMSFGGNGQGPGDLSGPAYIAAAGDRLMVYEIRNRRFSCFDLEGKFLFHHIEKGLGYRIQKIRGLPNGDFVLEWDITDFAEPGTPQDCRIEICGPDLKKKKTLVEGRIHLQKIIQEPVRTNIPMPFPKRYHWEVSPDGHIIIGFSDNYQIDIYDLAGKKVQTFSRPHTPLPVTKQDEKEFYGMLSFASSDGTQLSEPPDYVKNHIVFPSEKPVFRDVLVDCQGNILVCLHKQTQEEEWRAFDAFDPKGNFISSVQVIGDELPRITSRMRLDKEGFWLCRTDAEDLPVVSKWVLAEAK